MTRTWLHSGPARLEIAPELGGAVTRFTIDGRDIFRPTPSSARDAAAAAAFPLVPFTNRIGNATFAFDGRVHRIAADRAGGRHALHGTGWRSCWTIEDIDATSANLKLAEIADWPWRCNATQSLTLRDDGLDIAISLENADATNMPAGIGWHPAFVCGSDCEIRLQVEGYLPTIGDLPTKPARLPDDWRFEAGVLIDRLSPIDHCLIGWTGVLELLGDDIAIRVSAENCAFLQVYAPATADFVCLEPQTCAPDAFNREATFGARRIAPGERLTIRTRIDIAG
jgi:aldose 1-epimerase